MAEHEDTGPADARHAPLTQADKLRQDAQAAAEVRALANHPDVVALRVEKVRRQIDVLIWVGIGLGLAFTMVNVQTFAAAGAPAGSLAWLAAWLLDPMVSLTLVAVLRAEQITARYQVTAGVWANRTKWFAFLATYVMNTWQSWHGLNLAGIVLHSVPPVLVFCAAETAPWLRDRLTEAVNRAADTTPGTTATGTASVLGDLPQDVAGAEQQANLPTGEHTSTGAVPVEVEAERTVPLPAVPPADPGAVAAVRPVDRPRSGSTRKAGARPRSSARTGTAGARSIEALRAELAAAIEAGELDTAPSAESIRKTLRISPARARRLRDEHTTATTPTTATGQEAAA